jgi:hypothetical protein
VTIAKIKNQIAITFVIVLVLFLFSAHTAIGAGVKPSDWALAEVNAAIEHKIVPTELQTDYATPISRSDFCKVVIAFVESKSGKDIQALLDEMRIKPNANEFTDTNDIHIAYASSLGIVNGKGNGKFAPDSSITREEAATMLTRTVKALSLDDFKSYSANDLTEARMNIDMEWAFRDYYKISDWAYESVEYIASCRDWFNENSKAVMGSMGADKFEPQSLYTREQSYISFNRLCDMTRYIDGRMPLKRELPDVMSSDPIDRLTLSNWRETALKYIYKTGTGYTIISVEQKQAHSTAPCTVHVETYDANWNFIKHIQLNSELEIFGGAYMGSDGNYYIMTGQKNEEENPDKEVFRIVKYDSNWNRMIAASIKSGISNICIPFDCGNSKMTDNGNTLVIHTSRERFRTSDGLRHESNLTVKINIATMEVIYQSEPFPTNHVSHSFDQFVRYDGKRTVYVDHGDGDPRAIVLQIEDPATYDNITKTVTYKYELLKAFGERGDNFTGLSPGGFEISTDHYLVTASTIDQNFFSHSEIARNAVLLTIPRNDTDMSNIKSIEFTKFPHDGNMSTGIPWLVKISDNRFVVLWTEFEFSNANNFAEYAGNIITKFAVVDNGGNILGDIRTTTLRLNEDVQPIYSDGSIVWLSYGIKPSIVHHNQVMQMQPYLHRLKLSDEDLRGAANDASEIELDTPGELVKIPKLAGLSGSEFVRQLEESGFNVEIEYSYFVDTPNDYVTAYAAGGNRGTRDFVDYAEKGSTVTVYINMHNEGATIYDPPGSNPDYYSVDGGWWSHESMIQRGFVPIPDVIGKPKDEVIAIVSSLGFSVKIIENSREMVTVNQGTALGCVYAISPSTSVYDRRYINYGATEVLLFVVV